MNKNSTQEKLLQHDEDELFERKEKKSDDKVIPFLRNVVMVVLVLVGGASAIFIMLNSFYFAYQAFKFGYGNDSESTTLENFVILIGKFLMLLFFTVSMALGTLVPLAMLYILRLPTAQQAKAKEKKKKEK